MLSLSRLAGLGWLTKAAIVCITFASGLIISNQADASGWTVYIQHACRPGDGWIRSGFAHDTFKSEADCIRSIQARIRENQRHGQDNENFAVIFHNQRPEPGRLTNYVRGYVYNHQARCSAPRTCLFYAVLRVNGRLGYLGGYQTEAEAIRHGRAVARANGWQFSHAFRECR